MAVSTRSARVLRRHDGRFEFAHRAPRGEQYAGAAIGGSRLALVRRDSEHGLSHIDVTAVALQRSAAPNPPRCRAGRRTPSSRRTAAGC